MKNSLEKDSTIASDSTHDQRRDFLKKTLAGSALLTFGGVLPGFSPKSYAKIIGANEKVRVGVMGVNSRGLALSSNYALQPNCEVVSISDVDSRAAEKCINTVNDIQKSKPANTPDFRKALENKDMDALVIAAPDRWHLRSCGHCSFVLPKSLPCYCQIQD